MRVVLAAVADHAAVGDQGKLSVIGIFDKIHATGKGPFAHHQMVFVFRLQVESEDQNTEHRIAVELLDMDFRPLLKLNNTIKVGRIKPGEFGHANQIFNLQNLVLPKFGRYRFRVTIDSLEEPHDTVFEVVKRKRK